jgi:hypothetical protein
MSERSSVGNIWWRRVAKIDCVGTAMASRLSIAEQVSSSGGHALGDL